MQVPLALCYAVTVHKAQGLSLDRATLDVASSFADGQVYTALSRVRSTQGLALLKPITVKSIMTSADVVAYYATLM